MKALLPHQAASIERLDGIERWAVRVRVLCRQCGTLVARIDEPAVEADDGTRYSAADAHTGAEFGAVVRLGEKDPRDLELRRAGHRQTRQPLEVVVLLERPFAGSIGRDLPTWCHHHGALTVPGDAIVRELTEARTTGTVTTVRC